MSYSALSALQPHICSSEVAMSYAWVALELLLFPGPCAAACEEKKNRSEQKGRYFLSGSATEGQQIISQIITPQCKHGHLRTYAWARMFPKVCVGGGNVAVKYCIMFAHSFVDLIKTRNRHSLRLTWFSPFLRLKRCTKHPLYHFIFSR